MSNLPYNKLSHSFLFALAISGAIILFIFVLGAVSTAIYNLICDAFNMFPYHAGLATLIFWLWFSVTIMPEDDEE